MTTLCYFGIYRPTWARDRVLLEGLTERGVKIIECVDGSPGWRKLFRLVKKHRLVKHRCDLVLVGYLSNLVAPLARLVSPKPVVYNACNSLYEGAVLDRRKHSWRSPRRYFIWLIDFFAFHAAHLVLVESAEQQKFIRRQFLVPARKLKILFTGADDAIFSPDPAVKKRDIFTVLFRGWFVPATGVEFVLEAAKLLRDEKINFLLIGRGPLTARVKKTIAEFGLGQVKLITEFLPEEELRRQMLSCHLALGQFSNHPRLERTIQNKTFESLALGLPYITRNSPSNRELLTDGENCLFTKAADAKDLAAKILLLKNNLELANKIAQNGLALYRQKLTPAAIANRFLQIVSNPDNFHINTRTQEPKER